MGVANEGVRCRVGCHSSMEARVIRNLFSPMESRVCSFFTKTNKIFVVKSGTCKEIVFITVHFKSQALTNRTFEDFKTKMKLKYKDINPREVTKTFFLRHETKRPVVVMKGSNFFFSGDTMTHLQKLNAKVQGRLVYFKCICGCKRDSGQIATFHSAKTKNVFPKKIFFSEKSFEFE